MSRMICIMGESASGKTTSMRNLDPETTYYIDCDLKGLGWRGWRNQYNASKKNFYCTRDIPKITSLIVGISEKCPNIKTIVIDTLNTCMVDKEFKGMKESGYAKWSDLAMHVWNLCEVAATLRPDLTVIIVMHSETLHEEDGYEFTRIKTNGRKLEKVILESLFGVVLLAKRKDDGEYIFETVARKSTAKAPLGAFDTEEIPNDINLVLKALEDF